MNTEWVFFFTTSLALKRKLQFKKTDEIFPMLPDEWIILMRTTDPIQLPSINLHMLCSGCLVLITY